MALTVSDLQYANLRPRLQSYVNAGLPESASFLSWFLENYYRLEDFAARDCICDKPNDKGVDGIYADDVSQEIHVFQAKLRQKDNAKGEIDLKSLVATLTQFESGDAVRALSDGTASPELKKLLRDQDIADKVEADYDVRGVFVTNVDLDVNATEFLSHNPDLIVFAKSRLASEYVDPNLPVGVDGAFTFSADEGYIEYAAGTDASMRLFLAKATELVQLKGIADQSLFSLNVRLSLGNTSVNRDIRRSIEDKKQHVRFPLFHNGMTMVAKKVTDDAEEVTVEDYVVVNGAQSLTTLYDNKPALTSDLRILLRIVEVGENRELASQITNFSNNQNAIKPRDLRSNNSIQTRLKGEFEQTYKDKYYYVIKQGEKKQKGIRVENDEAGRLLLAFDLQEPWNAHQIYRVFDDDYARIFGRPTVNAHRIVFLWQLSSLVSASLAGMDDQKVASYRLTRYFLMYCLRQVLDMSAIGRDLVMRPEKYLFKQQWDSIVDFIESIVIGLVSDFEDDLAEADEEFDYKADLKSPLRVPNLARSLVKSYQRDLRRKKVDDPDKLFKVAS